MLGHPRRLEEDSTARTHDPRAGAGARDVDALHERRHRERQARVCGQSLPPVQVRQCLRYRWGDLPDVGIVEP